MSDVLHAIARNGEIIAEQGGSTVVPWWSYTKTILAAAALTLVRDGELQLDATIEGERFTLRRLLQHRAGLFDYGELPEYHAAVARGDKPWSETELLERADAARLRYEPGHGWGYSNIGYMMVSRLIERVADAPLNAVLTRRIFGPLGIGSARLAVTGTDLIGAEMGEAEIPAGSITACWSEHCLKRRCCWTDCWGRNCFHRTSSRRCCTRIPSKGPWCRSGRGASLATGSAS